MDTTGHSYKPSDIEISHSIYRPAKKESAEAASWVFTSLQGPPTLYYHELPPIKYDEVQIRVLYTSMCQSDLMTVRAKWGPINEMPFCPGHEVVGIITAIGVEVKTRKVGERVGVAPIRGSCSKCDSCQKKLEQYCDNRQFTYHQTTKVFGGYSTHVQCQAKHAIHLPEDLDIKTAAPLLCAGLTVFSGINKFKQVGIKCAVLSIGGLGHLAIQFASKMGMEVTAFTSSYGREKELHDLGATHISHSTDLKKLALQQGQYQLVVNTAFVEDPQVYKAYQRLVRPGGTLVLISSPDKKVKLQLDTQYIIENSIRIASSLIGSVEDTAEMLEFASNFGVKPIVETVPFDRLPEAFAKLEKGRPMFRMNIEVESWAKENNFCK